MPQVLIYETIEIFSKQEFVLRGGTGQSRKLTLMTQAHEKASRIGVSGNVGANPAWQEWSR